MPLSRTSRTKAIRLPLIGYFRFDDTPLPTSSTKTGPSSTATPVIVPVKKSVPVGAIAGGVVGGVVLLAAIIGLLFYLRRRKRVRPRAQVDLLGEPEPSMAQRAGSNAGPYPGSSSFNQSSNFAPGSSHNLNQSSTFASNGHSNGHSRDLSSSHFQPFRTQDGSSTDEHSFNPYASSGSAGVPNASRTSLGTSAAVSRRLTLRDARQKELESQVSQLRAQLEGAHSNPNQRVLAKQREAEEAVNTCPTSAVSLVLFTFFTGESQSSQPSCRNAGSSASA